MGSKFEAKFGKYAIKNISLVMIICYALGYMIQLIAPALLDYMYLNPYEIIHHLQIWRVFTWILIPPDSFGFFTLIVLYFYYSIGTSLEITWGTYRYNVYLLSGYLFTILGAFIFYGISVLNGTDMLWDASIAGSAIFSLFFTTYYVNMSIFLAYAATFPEAQVLLLFIIPIKVKFLGIIYGAIIVYSFVSYAKAGVAYLPMCVVIAASLLNFVIFFFTMRKRVSNDLLRAFRRRANASAASGVYSEKVNSQRHASATMRPKSAGITRHKCAICGATEVTNPELQFRFCSKCNGNYEYCENHIFTHTHIT
ncbi:MAG: hypothetical protein K6A38_01215 [Lachnospiraceae bacterium]|nr:hypothetical protein [Lachnospiraceae bacterium]